jgi:hypothetical protein
VLNVIIIQKVNTKSGVGQHGPQTKGKSSKHPLLTGHTRRAPLVEIRYTGLRCQSQHVSLTTGMKQIIPHMGQ